MTTKPNASEFPTDWHRDTYIECLKRELEGARARADETAAENVLGELARLGVNAERQTRPRSSRAKETR